MDSLIRFVNIIAWLGAVIFGSQVVLVFVVGGVGAAVESFHQAAEGDGGAA